MRIKSVTPTNKFAGIEFKEVIKDPLNKMVYTPSGFQPVLACELIKRGPTLKIKTDGHELICDPQHKVRTHHLTQLGENETFACDLDPKWHRLEGYNGSLKEFTIEPGPVEDLYDIQLPDPHWWYTSGVVSHNSIVLCNNAISSLRGDGPGGDRGQDVLLITFELDAIKTAFRCVAAAAGVPISEIGTRQDYVRRVMGTMQKTYKKRLLIHELPPDECSVNHIYALMDNLKRLEGWKPDVVIIDYLDLMVSRNPAFNKDDYHQQKHVANEIRGLAKNENVLVFTATQTNRSGSSGEVVVDLTKAAESFGKQFSLDYVISLAQSDTDRLLTPPRVKLFIAKNRNGPKHETIVCEINYDTMQVKESL